MSGKKIPPVRPPAVALWGRRFAVLLGALLGLQVVLAFRDAAPSSDPRPPVVPLSGTRSLEDPARAAAWMPTETPRAVARVAVRVVGSGGTPVSGARIVATSAVSRHAAESGPDGIALVETVANRPVSLLVAARGFEVLERNMTPVAAGGAREFETVARLVEAMALVGQVVDVRGRPIRAATVGLVLAGVRTDPEIGAALPEPVQTDADGLFVLRRAPRAGFALRVEATGFAISETSLGDEPRVHVVLGPAGTIVGTLRGAAGELLAGLSVVVIDLEGELGPVPAGRATRSAADGTYRVTDAPAGRRVRVRAVGAEGTFESAPFVVPAEGTYRCDVGPEAASAGDGSRAESR